MRVNGFLFSAVEAGVRYPNRLDLGLIYSDSPCVAAGVFTQNIVKAAPVVIDIQRLQELGQAQAVLVNSGCANACTGPDGEEDALFTGKLAAERLGIDENLIQLASTGVIGERLQRRCFSQSMEALVDGLSASGFERVAEAIMTTDTVKKTAFAEVAVGDRVVKIMGMAKGAGMIMPNMATMLAFVVTDALIERSDLQQILTETTDTSFNRITVDGDTSTNDMVLLLANGKAGNRAISSDYAEGIQAFKGGLEKVLADLALQIVADGEGATKTVTICVEQAATDADAAIMARTIANSSLVKTAFFGEDANWGRILAAMGRSGVVFEPNQVALFFDAVCLVRDGLGLGEEAEQKASEVLKQKAFTITVNLGLGKGSGKVHTCDLSLDYVKINADYRS
ncbi:MAG: bifunctional ornithine acetyltransferase/N-acetylglutamate synthase [Deltaproteobacteria bacterium]|nr:MAG: bifunctional ornithine acetyltransferase/N-acetylglutamate synthase [Deltaproteobacteria bacterium]PIE73380.1 MAG: bifunctional ornithine acetyltransferase/N-acetylglutamate synthase [Deltaproteobacteria bacterium]